MSYMKADAFDVMRTGNDAGKFKEEFMNRLK
jgi:hypothetical protein